MGNLSNTNHQYWILGRCNYQLRLALFPLWSRNLAIRYVRQGKWIELKKDLWAESITGNPICVYCKKKNATTLAHAIIHKRYGKKHRKLIEVKENACPCCDDCQKISETRDGRTIAWIWLCLKYGGTHMKKFLEDLPFHIKEEYE